MKRMRLSPTMLSNLRAGLHNEKGYVRDTYKAETRALLSRKLIEREWETLQTRHGDQPNLRHKLTELGRQQLDLWNGVRRDGHLEGCRQTKPIGELGEYQKNHVYSGRIPPHDVRCYDCGVRLIEGVKPNGPPAVSTSV